MGQLASLPVELIRVQRCGGATWRAAVAEMQGWRSSHEDAHFMADARAPGGHALFGVLDGHGGSSTARIAARHLPATLAKAAAAGGPRETLTQAVQKAFVEMDASLRIALQGSGGTMDSSGSTCVVAGVCPSEGGEGQGFDCFIANAGDSRGLLVSRDASKGTVRDLVASRDHKPGEPDERERILKAGGFVGGIGFGGDVPRVDGNLAVSRGLGDFTFKQNPSKTPEEQKVSCIPDLFFARLQKGDFIVLACDGIFDVVSSEILAERVLQEVGRERDLGAVAAQILRDCLTMDSKDNMTLMLVELGVPGDVAVEEALLGLELYRELKDDSVRRLYRRFLEQIEEDGGVLPDEAKEILEKEGHNSDVSAHIDELTRCFLLPSETPAAALRRYRPQLKDGGAAFERDRDFARLAELCDALLASGLTSVYESTREELLLRLSKRRPSQLLAASATTATVEPGMLRLQGGICWHYRWDSGPQAGKVFGPFDGNIVEKWISAGCFSAEKPAMFRRCSESGEPEAEEWIPWSQVCPSSAAEAHVPPSDERHDADEKVSASEAGVEQEPANKRSRSS